MQLEEAQRQLAEAKRTCSYHLQLRIEERALPTLSQLESGDDVARFKGIVIDLFRQSDPEIRVGSSLDFTIEHCIPESLCSRFAMMGAFTVISDPLATAGILEVVLDQRLVVSAGLVVPVSTPRGTPEIPWKDDLWT